jgi:hypothetical protein
MVQYFDPHIYSEAMGNPLWEAAMEKEYDSLLENQTWDLVPLPPGRKLVRCEWVYQTKRETDGQVRRYKERLISNGFHHFHGIYYE